MISWPAFENEHHRSIKAIHAVTLEPIEQVVAILDHINLFLAIGGPRTNKARLVSARLVSDRVVVTIQVNDHAV